MSFIDMFSQVGAFAENKNIAQKIRLEEISPILDEKQEIVLDFKNVGGATQSFIHALISEAIRQYGIDTLDLIIFKNCNEIVKKIISIVIDYTLEGME